MKNIFKKTVLSFATGAVALLSTGCTDLSENLYDQLSDQTIDLTNPDELSQLLGGAVTNYRYLVTAWDSMWILGEMCTDQQMIPLRIQVGWGAQYINLHKHDWNQENAALGSTWTFAYQGITYCNMVLDAMGEETEDNKVLRSHVRFYRAMFYYHLLDFFRNVPLQTTSVAEAGYLPEQEGAEAVYNFVVDEFNDIKDKIGTDKIFGYGNRYAVCMALAKMYMNRNAWLGKDGNDGFEAALTELQDIIDNGGYDLASDYSEPFRENIATCPEVIFAIPQDRTHTSNWTMQSYAFPQTGLEAYGSTAAGYNGSCAVPQFIDTYDPEDKRLPATWAMGTQHYAVKNGEDDYTPNAGDPIPFADDDWSGTGYLTYNQNVHSIDNPGAYQQEGYRIHKYEIPGGNNQGTTATDIAMFRYTDVLMMKAECLLRLGRDEQTAADLVTQVRQRAFDNATKAKRTVADLKGGSKYAYGHNEYTSVGFNDWGTHVTTYEGGEDIELGGLLDDLGWEFVGELHRRQDMVRFRTTSGVSVYTAKSYFCKDGNQETYREAFPIPNDAMLANIKLVQNTGYSK